MDSSSVPQPPMETDGSLEAAVADDVAAGHDAGADDPDVLSESDGPSSGPSSGQCPITMPYVDEAWAEIQTGQWPACPDGGGCAAGDCCLMYTGWSPPTPMNTTACVPIIDGQ